MHSPARSVAIRSPRSQRLDAIAEHCSGADGRSIFRRRECSATRDQPFEFEWPLSVSLWSHRRANGRACVPAAVENAIMALALLRQWLSAFRAPSVLPNPSLHPTFNSRLRRLLPAGELKR
jgi:hypothetical protein